MSGSKPSGWLAIVGMPTEPQALAVILGLSVA